MIEINLLPGARKSTKARGAATMAALSAFAANVKDPFLIAALVSVGLSGTAIGFLYTGQAQRAADVEERERIAIQDSTRYAAVLAERRKAQAQLDDVTRQIAVIRQIDNNRYVWPHVMDEVSRALPPYTWLTAIQQTSDPVLPPAAASAAAAADSTKKDTTAAAGHKKGTNADTLESATLKFSITGNTVDIQALTRFMRVLEASPFVQGVTLAKSNLATVDGREVTAFELAAEYQRPDSAAIQTVPVSLSVR